MKHAIVHALNCILVANRGEIACRVIRGIQALGKRAVAVYSDADADAPHVQLADQAVHIGPSPARQSYLSIDQLISAATASGADAIHPGYGFLSENAAFAQACAEAGLVFIGPEPEAITLMGNKAAAKRRMLAEGVPCIPGYQEADQSDAALETAAASIGYPLMVKASAGGGGRGMRLVPDKGELSNAIRLARAEALNAFGSGDLILEKAITRPRHVEIQVFADQHGQVVHFGERDCSVQRRHQKVVEEAPCPVMSEDLRAQMGTAAVLAARSIDYCGAGTVEFLLDESGAFYFLEMNTRLQVEHPVTEMITAIDLVALQIRVAEGQPLGITQDQVSFSGHAIEVRLYAEDPHRLFLPCTGRVELWLPPQGDGIRVDAGIATGSEISSFYDPMVAKIIAWGETRDVARRRLLNALERTVLFGVSNNRDFLIAILNNTSFASGQATTALIEQEFATIGGESEHDTADVAIAAVLQYCAQNDVARARSVAVAPELINWRSDAALVSRYQYLLADAAIDISVMALGPQDYQVSVGDDQVSITLIRRDRHMARVQMDEQRFTVWHASPDETVVHLSVQGRSRTFVNQLGLIIKTADRTGGGKVIAPMHGRLVDVMIKPGDKVSKGDRLLVIEAMKMQHEICAAIDGIAGEIRFQVGDQVAADTLILDITPVVAESQQQKTHPG